MVWPPRFLSPSDILKFTLRYSHQFAYPLTQAEIWFWQAATRFPESSFSFWTHVSQGYFYLPGRRNLVRRRLACFAASRPKWHKARHASGLLSLIPTVTAVFVTGSLAMDNCPPNDDIDIMLVTSSNSLWLTRPVVVLLLRLLRLRRNPGLPEHSSFRVKDKICDNLYLDTAHLAVLPSGRNSFYLAHEILQAKPLFDRGGVHFQFLTSNSWVRQYLPVAYSETLKQAAKTSAVYQLNIGHSFLTPLIYFLNLIFFTLQYLYMRSRFTHERVGLGFAFFHPRPVMVS